MYYNKGEASIIEKREKMKLNLLLDTYLEHNRSLRKGTIEYYIKNMKCIIEYFESINIYDSSDITEKEITRFVDHEVSKGNKVKTIRHKLSTLSMLYGHIDEKNPIAKVKLGKNAQVDIEVIPDDVISSIFTYLKQRADNDSVRGIIDYCIVHIFLETGIRRTELTELKWENVSTVNDELRLKYTKNRKNRTVYISNETQKYLNRLNKITKGKRGDYIFINMDTREKLSPNSITKKLERIKKKLDLPSYVSISCHKWRHTCATKMIDKNFNIIEVMKYLDHSDIRTTERYIHVKNEDLKQKFKNRMFTGVMTNKDKM